MSRSKSKRKRRKKKTKKKGRNYTYLGKTVKDRNSQGFDTVEEGLGILASATLNYSNTLSYENERQINLLKLITMRNSKLNEKEKKLLVKCINSVKRVINYIKEKRSKK